MVGQLLISTVACSPVAGGSLLLQVGFSGDPSPEKQGCPSLQECEPVSICPSPFPSSHPFGDCWQSGWVAEKQTLGQGHTMSLGQNTTFSIFCSHLLWLSQAVKGSSEIHPVGPGLPEPC